MPDQYSWPPEAKRKVIGKRVTRLDGMAKSTGRAKYNSDIRPDGLLYAILLTSPYAHARIKSIDTSDAEKVPGVTAVRIINGAGKELNWEGQEIAAVAAMSESVGRDAARMIRVEFDPLPFLVREDDLSQAGDHAKPAGESVTGDPDKAFTDAGVISEGFYGIPVITHCCLETHGQVVAWKGDKVEYWPSTQSITPISGELARLIQVPTANIHAHMDYIGGGFGSKFQGDLSNVSALLSKASGGRPVKLFFERATDLMIAGNRPSLFAKVKVAAAKDGTLTAWQSESWSTGGYAPGGVNPSQLPYVYRNVPNRRINHTAVSTNTGMQRAWRAPNQQQLCYVTCAALTDLALKLKMSPLDFFVKNTSIAAARGDLYKWQLEKAGEMIGWNQLWPQCGTAAKGTVKHGLGIGVNMWGGLGHQSQCRATIHTDGGVEITLGTQDLGTGTRTVIAQVAAETLGLPVHAVKVNIGDNHYPPSGPSGGSTTVGGVSASTRKAAVNALAKLLEQVAPALGSTPENLEAIDGRIQVKGNAQKSLTWKAACQKLGVNDIAEMGENIPRVALREGLISQGTAGVQMAHVSVDTETGRVKLHKMVAVQDCGMVINPKLAESQVYGACIMSTCGALMEERVADQQVGRILNANMEMYKLSGIADIGEIVVHMDIRPENDNRGVIGLGEPPSISGIAAIANAVAVAIGVRVPRVPLTPRRVLDALAKRSA
jgi:xanthine dehydrogenase YagR molybdenum-binding subunit